MNGNVRETSRVLGVSFETVRKYIGQDDKDEFSQIRSEKLAASIPEIIERCKQVQIVLLDALMDKTKIAEAPYRDIGVNFGIVTEKLQLITGEATERHEHRDTTDARDTIARRIDELAERRRARQTDSQPLREASG